VRAAGKKLILFRKIKLILMFLYNSLEIIYACCLLLLLLMVSTDIPKFGEPMQNQTIAVGREAVFSCVVDNLQTYKVSIVVHSLLIQLTATCSIH